MQVDTDSESYNLSNHISDILEKQTISQVERLRCELAMRLQQINRRVDKILDQVGMSHRDVSAVHRDIFRGHH